METPKNVAFSWVKDPEPDQSCGKFLALWEDRETVRVYAGNSEFHSYLVGAGKLPRFEGQKRFAAGSFTKDGEVVSWSSTGYGFDTPEDYRAIIENCFAEHRAFIQQYWGKSA